MRWSMPVRSLRCAAFVLSSMLMVASPAAAQAPLTILGLTIPGQVAGSTRAGEPHDYEKSHPGLGYSVKYKRPGWAIDVYVYTLNMSSIPDDPTSATIRNQLAQAKGDVLEHQKRGRYSNVVVRSDYTVNDAAGRTRFVCSELAYRHNDWARNVDSFVCLTAWSGKFFKIRMTTAQDAASSAEARRFVEGWIPVIWAQ